MILADALDLLILLTGALTESVLTPLEEARCNCKTTAFKANIFKWYSGSESQSLLKYDSDKVAQTFHQAKPEAQNMSIPAK